MTLKSSMSAKTTATWPGLVERLGEQRVEARAVGQAGQRVVVGLVVEPLGVALAGGDVDALGDVVVGLAVGAEDERVAPVDPADVAVGADVAALGLLVRPARLAARRGRAAGTKSQNHRPSSYVMAGAGLQRLVALQDATLGGEQRHRHRRVVERAAEALLGGLRGGADALALTPGDDVGDRQRGDEQAVDAGPAPRVVDVVEDGVGAQRAHRAVLEHDEADRQQVRPPLLVERERADHQEVVEVRLERAVPGDDEDGAAGQQGHRAQARSGRCG